MHPLKEKGHRFEVSGWPCFGEPHARRVGLANPCQLRAEGPAGTYGSRAGARFARPSTTSTFGSVRGSGADVTFHGGCHRPARSRPGHDARPPRAAVRRQAEAVTPPIVADRSRVSPGEATMPCGTGRSRTTWFTSRRWVTRDGGAAYVGGFNFRLQDRVGAVLEREAGGAEVPCRRRWIAGELNAAARRGRFELARSASTSAATVADQRAHPPCRGLRPRLEARQAARQRPRISSRSARFSSRPTSIGRAPSIGTPRPRDPEPLPRHRLHGRGRRPPLPCGGAPGGIWGGRPSTPG
jgi:hypothetical protein